MLEPFYPREYVDSTYEIDFESWYQKGYRGIIFDVDNTLVPHGAPADDRAKALFERLHVLGFQSILLSNNKEPRVKSFCEAVIGADYIYKAGKPNGNGRTYHSFCGRPDLYGCVGRKPRRDLDHPGKADPPEGGDTDRIKTVLRTYRLTFL